MKFHCCNAQTPPERNDLRADPGTDQAQTGNTEGYDDELFAQQLANALSSNEIAPQLRVIGIARDYLAQRVRDEAPALWQLVKPEEQRVFDAQRSLGTAQEELAANSHISWQNRVLSRIIPNQRARRQHDMQLRQQAVDASLASLDISP